MITKVYLKSQPKKAIDYPDCFPMINDVDLGNKQQILNIKQFDFYRDIVSAVYQIESVSRIEFRP